MISCQFQERIFDGKYYKVCRAEKKYTQCIKDILSRKIHKFVYLLMKKKKKFNYVLKKK